MKLFKTITVPGYVLALALLSASPLLGQNQDYDRLAPKPVTPPPLPASQAPATPTKTGGEGADDVLVPKLKGLVFVPTPQEVKKVGVTINGITLQNVTVPSQPDFEKLTSSYLDKALTRGKLNSLINDIILYYRKHDRPIIDVIVPEQEITSGDIQLVLLEGKLGKVSVAGNHWFAPGQIADGISTRPGESISAEKMQSDLDWINQNPFRSSDLVYRPGEKLSTTDLILQTNDRFPARFYAGYEDSGNATTGFDRYLAGVNYGDLFRIGQQVNYQYTMSGDGQSLRAHSGSYVIPLPWQNTLTFFGSYVDTKGAIPPLIGLQGRSYQISGRYSVPLPTLRVASNVNYKHTVSTGFDYKYNDNSLEFGGIATPDTLYDIDQFVIGYSGVETDPYGQLTINNQLYISPGNWGGNNNDAAFSKAHAGATSDYVYNTLILERLTKLPADWTLVLRGTLQTSNANLTPSEQLGFGGYDTIRGYDEREVNTDDGYIFTTELRTPSISLGEMCGIKEYKDQLQFLGFWDYGAAYNHSPLPGEVSEIPLSSVGMGVRYNINTYVTVRFDYGFQLLSTGFDNDQESRSDLGIVVSY